jgi:hypothetical protein
MKKGKPMRSRQMVLTAAFLLLAGLPAGAQVTSGVLHVNNTHMS